MRSFRDGNKLKEMVPSLLCFVHCFPHTSGASLVTLCLGAIDCPLTGPQKLDNGVNSTTESLDRVKVLVGPEAGARLDVRTVDLCDKQALEDTLTDMPAIDACIHFAALKVSATRLSCIWLFLCLCDGALIRPPIWNSVWLRSSAPGRCKTKEQEAKASFNDPQCCACDGTTHMSSFFFFFFFCGVEGGRGVHAGAPPLLPEQRDGHAEPPLRPGAPWLPRHCVFVLRDRYPRTFGVDRQREAIMTTLLAEEGGDDVES